MIATLGTPVANTNTFWGHFSAHKGLGGQLEGPVPVDASIIDRHRGTRQLSSSDGAELHSATRWGRGGSYRRDTTAALVRTNAAAVPPSFPATATPLRTIMVTSQLAWRAENVTACWGWHPATASLQFWVPGHPATRLFTLAKARRSAQARKTHR